MNVEQRNAARQRMVGAAPPAVASSSSPAAPAPTSLAVVRDLVAGEVQGLLAGAREANAAAAKTSPEAYALADKLIQAGVDELTKSWSPADRQALGRVMGTLDQLAGPDGKLNYGDKQAIMSSLLGDRAGIMRMVHQQIDLHVPGLGNNLAHRIADNSQRDTRRFRRTGRQGPVQRIRERVRGRIDAEARKAISTELNKALSQVKVDPATARKIDGGARHLSVEQMLQLGQDVQRLQRRFDDVGGRFAPSSSSGGPAFAQRVGQILGEAGLTPRVAAPPLREGIPSLRRPDALADTLLNALQGVQLGR